MVSVTELGAGSLRLAPCLVFFNQIKAGQITLLLLWMRLRPAQMDAGNAFCLIIFAHLCDDVFSIPSVHLLFAMCDWSICRKMNLHELDNKS